MYNLKTDLSLLHVGVSGDIEDVAVVIRVKKLEEKLLGPPAIVLTFSFLTVCYQVSHLLSSARNSA